MNFFIKSYFYLPAFLLALPMQVFSAEGNAAAGVKTSATLNVDPMSGSYLAQLVVGLFVVVLCIVALAWAAKKMKRFNPLADGSLKVIGGISMGSRERVALLQVGDKQLLIGIAPGRINTLHVLDTPIDTTNSAADQLTGNNFLDKFKTVMADANKRAEQNNK